MKNDYLSKENFLGLKGYLALLVLIHHTYQFSGILSGTYVSYIFLLLGRWAVTLFIFMTGYGLYSSYKSKGDAYIKSFPLKRILPFYLTYLSFFLIYLVFYLVSNKPVSIILVIKSLTFGGTIISFGWYFQLALFLYVSFWITFLITKNKYLRSTLTLFMLLLFIAFSYLVNCVYYIPVLTIAYIGGIHVSIHKNRLDNILIKNSYLILVASFILFAISSLLFITYGIRGFIIPDNIKEYVIASIMEISEISLCISISLIANKKASWLFKNKLSSFLGGISLEIYGIQGLILAILSPIISNIYVYALASMSLTIILAFLYHQIGVLARRIRAHTS